MDVDSPLLAATTATTNGVTSELDKLPSSLHSADPQQKLADGDLQYLTASFSPTTTLQTPEDTTATGRIRYEVTPPSQSWMMPLTRFTAMRRGERSKYDENGAKLPSAVIRYYREQDEQIDDFERVYRDIICGDPSGLSPIKEDDETAEVTMADMAQIIAGRLAKLSFFCNLGLLVAKSVAAGLSGALAIISSLIDSAVDLASGIIVWWTSRAVRRRSPYRYPGGRTRLEPVAIVILSVIMAVASVQIIVQSFERIGLLVAEESKNQLENPVATMVADVTSIMPTVEHITTADMNSTLLTTVLPLHWTKKLNLIVIILLIITILTKVMLFVVCKKYGSTPAVAALALDHRNDVVANIVVLASNIVSSAFWPYADPVAAIAIGLYIAYTWTMSCWEQTKALTGYTANPAFLQIVTFVATNHHHEITQVDTVRAFHHGTNYLVEVDIVLPEDMTVRRAHDVAETLQHKLERLDNVERAFVHIDYEGEHDPRGEHKQV